MNNSIEKKLQCQTVSYFLLQTSTSTETVKKCTAYEFMRLAWFSNDIFKTQSLENRCMLHHQRVSRLLTFRYSLRFIIFFYSTSTILILLTYLLYSAISIKPTRKPEFHFANTYFNLFLFTKSNLMNFTISE